MSKTIIFDLGGVLVHLDWDQVCAPLARRSGLGYDDVMKEVWNGPIVEASMLGRIAPAEFHQALCANIQVAIPFGPFIGGYYGMYGYSGSPASPGRKAVAFGAWTGVLMGTVLAISAVIAISLSGVTPVLIWIGVGVFTMYYASMSGLGAWYGELKTRG